MGNQCSILVVCNGFRQSRESSCSVAWSWYLDEINNTMLIDTYRATCRVLLPDAYTIPCP